jgi:hypothetical protein
MKMSERRRRHDKDDCKPRQKKCDRGRGHGHDHGGRKKCRSHDKPWKPVGHGGRRGRDCD